jgi:hypothetical protein
MFALTQAMTWGLATLRTWLLATLSTMFLSTIAMAQAPQDGGVTPRLNLEIDKAVDTYVILKRSQGEWKAAYAIYNSDTPAPSPSAVAPHR